MFKSPLLKSLWQQHRFKISITYTLNFVETLITLSLPASMGWLINDLFKGEYWGFIAYILNYVAWVTVGTFRRIYDTKVFSNIYNELIFNTIDQHRSKGIDNGRINARIELLKQVVSFFEHDLPFMMTSVVNIVGAMCLLYFYNPWLLLVCLVIILPSLLINYFYGKKILAVTNLVNNAYEQQLDALENKNKSELEAYFKDVRLLNIKKSNLDAYNFATLEFFVLSAIVVSMLFICRTPNAQYGDIVAMYGYVYRFAFGFDFVPHLTERLALMKDIEMRLEQVHD